MDTVTFLEALKKFTEEQTKDMILPTKREKGETSDEYRPAGVHVMALPSGKTPTKYAPYILHRKVTGQDLIPDGRRNRSLVTIRSIFCVFNEDAVEGSLMLMNLMERMRIALLKFPVVDNRYRLYTGDDDGKIETVIYQEDLQPYYVGEMVTTWEIPSVQEERQMLFGKDYL